MTTLQRSFLFVAALWTPAAALAVQIDEETQDRIGLHTEALEKATLQPQVNATGTVLSPAPLIDLFRQSAASRDAAEISREALSRAEKLFASGELVARKDVDTARGTLLQDEGKTQALEDRIALEWGQAFAAMSADQRNEQITQFLSGHRVIVRLAVTRQQWLEKTPSAAQLTLAGHDQPLFRTTTLLPATSTDPAFQSQAFLGIFDSENLLPPPGTQLKGMLDLPGEPEDGWAVPAAAVIYHQGKAWIYRRDHDDEFERIEIPATQPDGRGWFVGKEKLEAGEVVVTGAQSLLSKETLASEPAAGD